MIIEDKLAISFWGIVILAGLIFIGVINTHE